MSLDSWIDEHALSKMRALAPTRGNEPPAQEPAADFGFDPIPERQEALPESGEPARIAPAEEPDAAAVQRLRSRLAEIRRRAEVGGVVRTAPARIAPSVSVAPPAAPTEETQPPAPVVLESSIEESAERVESEEVVSAEIEPPAPLPEPASPTSSELPKQVETTEMPAAPPSQPGIRPQATGLVIPDGPLAVRLDAYRRWLDRECGLSRAVVFDRHGCPLHPADGQSSFIAAAVSLGVAWREACALTDPPGTLRAVHSAWGSGTMAVIPVPTRFGDLYVAGQVGAAIEPERAAEIGSALRRTAGV